MKAGVIGYPIKHSKSPIIHTYWLEQHNLIGTYEKIEIKPDELQSKVNDLVSNGFDGFNVTVPHKENIIALCEEIDDTAKKIGAVNTVTIKDGKLLGKNTDAFGFVQNIKSVKKFDFKNKTACVVGAGGASRAVIYGLLEQGVQKIYLTNRTEEKANNLKFFDEDKIEVISWDEKENCLNEIDLLINTTSLGMSGQVDLEINLDNLTQAALVTDIVYTPLMTKLLQEASVKGCSVVTGIGMLLHQARPSFEAWTGIMPDVTTELEGRVLK